MNGQRVVFLEVGSVIETCSYGCEHEVKYAQVKRLTETGQTRLHDNGYEKRQTPLFVDAQGRVYHQHVSIDFHGNTAYVRDGDNTRFRAHLGRGLWRDLTGAPIAEGTPPGPDWIHATPR